MPSFLRYKMLSVRGQADARVWYIVRPGNDEQGMNLEKFAERMGACPDAKPIYGIVINACGGF